MYDNIACMHWMDIFANCKCLVHLLCTSVASLEAERMALPNVAKCQSCLL